VFLRVLCGQFFGFPITRSRAITRSPDLSTSAIFAVLAILAISSHQRSSAQICGDRFCFSTSAIFASPGNSGNLF